MIYRGIPKLVMKVSFTSENLTEFKLLKVNSGYFENISKVQKYFFSVSSFMISQDYEFMISTYEMVIPSTIINKKLNKPVSIFTNSEDERYETLSKIKTALLEWSKSENWKGDRFSINPRITYHNNMWILY